MKFADLHTHTTASDGTDSLIRRVRDGKAKGFSCIAVTDHDTLHPSLNRPVQNIRGLEVISGSEIEVKLDGNKMELLAYFLDPSRDDGIVELLEDIGRKRVDRMKEMIGKVNDMIDSFVCFDEVAAFSDSTIARPHLAKALKDKREVDTIREAFEKFIGRNKPGYVPMDDLSPKEVIELVHENGGVVSLAHPGRDIRKESFGDVLDRLSEMGLDAVEVIYPYELFPDSFEMFFGRKFASENVEDRDLLITGGSDCHGSTSPKYYHGHVKVPYELVEKLKKRRKDYM